MWSIMTDISVRYAFFIQLKNMIPRQCLYYRKAFETMDCFLYTLFNVMVPWRFGQGLKGNPVKVRNSTRCCNPASAYADECVSIINGSLYLFIPRFNCFVERCSKSSCIQCTLRFLCSVRLALESLMKTIETPLCHCSGLLEREGCRNRESQKTCHNTLSLRVKAT